MESSDGFWHVYQNDDGSRLHWQGILNMLKEQREQADEEAASAAVNFFNGNLDHPDANGVFRYRKGGRSMLCTKTAVIAEKWRGLLKTNTAIRQRHEAAAQ